jgi:hypothetical protein
MSHDKKTPQKLNAHAKQRAEERYGLNLNKTARHEIVHMIQTDQAEFVGKESNTRTLWRVRYQDHDLNIVYDKARNTLCTVLPRDDRHFQEGGFEPPEERKRTGPSRAQITAELADLWKDIQ